jgi:RsiW-degrading membrane proteinase PrsW (M82 family)
MNIFLLLALALAPGISISFYIYYSDKHEPEPVGLLIISFIYGILSVLITIGISIPLNSLVTINEASISDQAIHAFGIVAFVEEFSKFIFVRGILYRNKNFNEPFDGIVYAVMVGMGFATLENIYYVLNSGGATAILRMFTAVPAHALFAVLMGYFLGKAKFEHKKEGFYSFVALFVATLFHGVYDYFLFITFVPGIWILAFFSLAIAFFLSKKAMEIHEEASPFKKHSKEEDSLP